MRFNNLFYQLLLWKSSDSIPNAKATFDNIKDHSLVYGSFVCKIHVRYNNIISQRI